MRLSRPPPRAFPPGVSFDLETLEFWIECETHDRDMPAIAIEAGWFCRACLVASVAETSGADPELASFLRNEIGATEQWE